MNCIRCGKKYATENNNGLCSKCFKKPFNKEKFNKKLSEATLILSTQGKLNNYIDHINKIRENEKLWYKYSWHNITEFLMQLEFDRLGWKVEYQKVDILKKIRHDFYLPAFKLDIEIDEKAHEYGKQSARDKWRDEIMGKRNIVRIPEQILKGNLEMAADAVIVYIIKNTKNEDKKYLDDKFKQSGININWRMFAEEKLKYYLNVL